MMTLPLSLRIEVDPGESLADTAALSGVIDIRPFRKAEEGLYHKFGLKPSVTLGDNQAVGIGGKAKVLGKVEMPSGMGGVNGIVKYTVVDSPGVPPLTPVSLLKQVGAVIDLNSNTVDLKKIETTTTLRALPSGRADKLTEFAPDVFRPMTLPGEFKPRSSKQCAGFSSGFVYTVRDRSHLSPSHHQHDPDLCVDDTMSSDLFSVAQGTSNFECSLASGFDVDANPVMGLVAEVRWRKLALRCLVHVTRASWQIVLDSWQQASSRIAQTECTHLLKLLVHRANQWASMDVCDKKRGGCGAIINYFHSAASIAHKEAKAKAEGEKNEVTTISQRAAQIVEGTYSKESEDDACPRCDRELHVFNTASGPILRCRGWSLAGTPCTLIKARHNGAVVPGGLRSTNRTGGGNTPKTRGWHTGSTSYKRLRRPRCKLWRQTQLGHRNSWLRGNFSINSISIFNINSSSWRRRQRILGKCFRSTGDRWSMDTATDLIGV